MSKVKKRFVLYTVIMILLSFLVAAARSVMLLESLGDDPTFTVHSELFYAVDRFWKPAFGAVILLGVLSFFFFRKNSADLVCEKTVSGWEKTACFLCAACFFICFLILFTQQVYRTLVQHDRSVFGFWALIDSVLLLPSGIYFLCRGLGKTGQNIAVLSFFPSVWTVIALMLSYFSDDYSLINPTRILGNLALACASLLFLSEVRQYTNYRPSSLYLTILFPSFTVTAAYGISLAVTSFLWIGKAPDVPFTGELVLLPVSFLIFTKLISMISNKKNNENSEAL
ncbi:MAG: hypothetical protein KBS76_03065 [Ruminococcus sp.]|nr:hypothetical protein [Candidatus Apopatosoma intestinale]